MSWLSEVTRWVRARAPLYERLKGEAPQVIPFLEALEKNDYEGAANILVESGDSQELLAKMPQEIQWAVRQSVPLVCEMLDRVVPEEAVLRVFELLHVWPEA